MVDHGSLSAGVVTDARAEHWGRARGQLDQLLTSLGVTDETWTQAVFITPVRGPSERELVDRLARAFPDDRWALLTAPTRDGGPASLLALPVPEAAPASSAPLLFPYVEVQSRIGAWWLVGAWRGRQLAHATWSLADADALIPAAACARALIETAAAFWNDACRLRDAWDAAKRSSRTPQGVGDSWLALVRVLYEVQYGAKFDDRVPDLARVYGRIKRSNVLGQIDKLAKVTSPPIAEPYQWLCNTVHPSVGGTLAFSSPLLRHETRTHNVATFAPFSTSITSEAGVEEERTVHNAIADAAVTAVEVLAQTLDAALVVLDDVCLTADIGRISEFETWRKLRRPARNEKCPCRSERKAKVCSHAWGEPAPPIPRSFHLEQ